MGVHNCSTSFPIPERVSIPGWKPFSQEDLEDIREFEINSMGINPEPTHEEIGGASFRLDYSRTPIEQLPLYREFVARGWIKE